MYKKWKADNVVLAQKFDVRLKQDVLKGMAGLVNKTKKLGGWHTHMV